MKNKNCVGITLVVVMLLFVSIGMSTATVWTDQLDYPPGSAVTISGDNSDNAGYISGETVNVRVNGPYLYDSSCSGVVDENGVWSCHITLSSDYTAEGNYTYTAIGQTSGATQSGTFTDGTLTTAPISILKTDCVTRQTSFVRGDVVCAKTTITISGGGTGNLAIQWFDPSNNMVRNTIFTGQSNGAIISDFLTTTSVSPTGTWTVKTCKGGSLNPCSGPSTLDTKTFILNVPPDTTPPVINPTISGTKGIDNWYTSDVTVTWSVTDPESGISSSNGCGSTMLTSETTGTTLTCSAIDGAGLSSSNSVTIKIDKTGPSTTLSVKSGTPGTNGWYTSDVAVSTTGIDPISDSVTCIADQTLSAETTGQIVTSSCTNGAGLTTSATPLTIKIDKTGPSASLSVTAGTLGTNGWYTSDVTVSTTGSDSISGPVTCTADQYLTGETIGAIFNGKCTNDAGLYTDTSPLIVKLDETGPSANLVVTGTTGANGWYIGDVTISTSGTDSIGSPVSCTADQFQIIETTGAVFNGKCTNDAGLSTDAGPLTIKLDKTGPTAGLSVIAGTLGSNGWYTSDLTVSTTGSDSISDSVTCTADQYLTGETIGAVFNGKCTNGAGLSTDASPLTVKLDETGPTATLSVTAGTLGTNGWYTSDVTVSTSGTDSISSPVTCSPDQFQTTETAGTVFNGVCTNDAGLKTDASPLTVKLDKTPPVVTASADRSADHNGWYNNPVTVSFSGTDVLPGSGIDSCDPSVIYSTDSATASVSGTCKDNAGNIGTGTLNFKYDSTPPTATLAVTSGTQGLNDWYTSAVVVSTTGSDSVSSPVICTGVQSFTTETIGITVTGSCANDAGLSTNAVPLAIKIDLGPPTITIAAPTNGANYILNQVVAANYNCVDTISGVASCVGSVANGANIDTGSVGTKTFVVTSTDNAGDQGQQQYQYKVIYGFSGILQPINKDGSSIFKLGSTVPVKFQLTDYGGNYISTAVATINVAKIDNNVEGTYVEAISTSAATTGNLFRYDSASNQYIFNWGTKGLTTGTWSIKISINDGTTYTAKISLK